MKILVALIIGGLLVASGFYLRDTLLPASKSGSSSLTSDSCGPNGCGGNSMLHNIEITDEKVFIREMIPHHQEAIDTSKIVLAQTQDPELKKFTQDVIAAQAKEVAQMKGWLKSWFNEEYVTNSNYMPMMGDLSKFEGKALDKMYVEGMIRHHQGAIDMAQKVLTLNPRPEIKKMADDIISVQQTEVNTLQQWLNTKYQGVEAKDEMNHMMNIH
jgi:uncharacterized protein (DUF305 family)